MGNSVATFTDQQLENYQDCTFFTRKQIMAIFSRFRRLDPAHIPEYMTKDESHTLTVSMDKIEEMPELKENPFKRRICQVFSHDGTGDMTFDDFLDMLNCLSENAPKDVKVYYAFKIYDFDGDHFITARDIERTLAALTSDQHTPEEIAVVCLKVLQDADDNEDGKISLSEFQSVVSKAPDFLSTFRVRF